MLVVAAVVALVSGACGDDSNAQSPATSTPIDVDASKFVDMTGKDRVEIKIVDNEFQPRYVTITAGTTVVWTNEGRNLHNIKSVDEGVIAVSADTQLINGKSLDAAFANEGDAAYFCTLHGTPKNGQTGGIRVVAKK